MPKGHTLMRFNRFSKENDTSTLQPTLGRFILTFNRSWLTTMDKWRNVLQKCRGVSRLSQNYYSCPNKVLVACIRQHSNEDQHADNACHYHHLQSSTKAQNYYYNISKVLRIKQHEISKKCMQNGDLIYTSIMQHLQTPLIKALRPKNFTLFHVQSQPSQQYEGCKYVL